MKNEEFLILHSPFSIPVCRLLPYSEADGPYNMAADEVLLQSAVKGVASLRFYGWTAPTVSLGYFQPEHLRREHERLIPLSYVRRASGGGTLVHHHEVTYALALPPGPPRQTSEPWLARMHVIIAAALEQHGIDAHIQDRGAVSPSSTFLCYLQHTPGDLLIGSHKIVGSAQRKQRGALMQHGGILLSASHHTPELPGIRELSGRCLTVEETCVSVRRAFTDQSGWEVEPGDWTPFERQAVAALAADKYSQDGWNRKR